MARVQQAYPRKEEFDSLRFAAVALVSNWVHMPVAHRVEKHLPVVDHLREMVRLAPGP